MAKDLLNGIAITSFIIAVSVTLPIIGFFFVLIVPLPVFFYRAKLGRKLGAVIPVVAILLTSLMAGGVSVDFFFVLGFLVLGFALSECLERRFSIEKALLFTCGTVLLVSTFGLFFYSSFSNYNLVSILSNYVGKNLDYTLTLYKNMEMPEDSIRMIEDSMDQIQYMLVRILPGIVAGSTLFVAWLNLLLARSVFISRGLFFPDFGPLNRWKSPEFLIWAAIGAGIFSLIPDKAVKVIGINALLVLFVVYFFQGIAIVAFFFEKKRLPRMLRTFLYTLIGFQQVLLFLIVGMGFFDVWLDIRKLNHEEETTPS